MPIQYVLLPLFVQVLLTFCLYGWMAYHRVSLIRGGAVSPRDVPQREPNRPPRSMPRSFAAMLGTKVLLG